uniref:NADH dehydrogenase subunit 2 n=1 Tax=Paramoeba aparasomata TaxID=2583407 RepID=A0A5P8HBW2_9EUKA|nr:NADH dehydrogenase subunit 2 [Paramoeba aparasomata]
MISNNNIFNSNILLIYKFNIVSDIAFMLPEIFIFISLMLVVFYSSFYSNFAIYKYIKLSLSLLNLISLVIIIYILLVLNSVCYENIISSYLLYNNMPILFIKILLSVLSLIIIKISYSYMVLKNLNFFEFYLFVFISLIALLLLVMAYDFILAYLAIELQGLCSYVLVAMNKSYNKSIESSLKYFVLGSFASSILLLGISLLYWSTGMTNFKDISDLMQLSFNLEFFNNIFLLGLTLIHIGIFFKLSVAPFHLWLPDIFYGSSKVVVLLFSLLPKLSLIVVLFKLNFLFMLKINWDFKAFYLYFVLLSLIFGIAGALKVEKLNKLIAYSSISHMGFLLCSVLSYNFEIFLLYIIIYSLISLSIFIVLFNLINPLSGKTFSSLYQLSYIKKINYILFISLVISFFSISGIPPLSGFFSKFFIFLSLINLNLNLLVLILLLFSVVSCFYYLRIIKIISFNNVRNWYLLTDLTKLSSYMLSLHILVNVFLFLNIPIIWESVQWILPL